MAEYTLSRREFFVLAGLGAAGVGVTAALGGCAATSIPKTSPFVVGPYKTGLAILGETTGTPALPQPFTTAELPSNFVCRDGKAELAQPPTRVLAAVYYPLSTRTPRPDTPIKIAEGGPFPILLYAHALRVAYEGNCAPPAGSPLTTAYYRMERDFTSVDFLLRHVASYGCVALAPDLSFLAYASPDIRAFEQRATVLLRYYNYLRLANGALFANRLDLSRVVLSGHSTGGGACLIARRQLVAAGFPAPVAMGLLAPETNSSLVDITSLAAEQAPNGLLVLEGTRDTNQSAESARVYAAGQAPKALVTIPGANHFGYTELCTLDNVCAANDPQGTISRDAQQRTGAAYLAALVRYYAQRDASARPYLSGARAVEGLELFGVSGIQVQQEGIGL